MTVVLLSLLIQIAQAGTWEGCEGHYRAAGKSQAEIEGVYCRESRNIEDVRTADQQACYIVVKKMDECVDRIRNIPMKAGNQNGFLQASQEALAEINTAQGAFTAIFRECDGVAEKLNKSCKTSGSQIMLQGSQHLSEFFEAAKSMQDQINGLRSSIQAIMRETASNPD